LRLLTSVPRQGETGGETNPASQHLAARSTQRVAPDVRIAFLSPAFGAPTTQVGRANGAGYASDSPGPHLSAIMSAIDALPGLRLLRPGDGGHAHVVVITDASLPMLARLASGKPPVAVVALTENPARVAPAVRTCGASGWAVVPPTLAPLALASAILAAAQGLTVVAPADAPQTLAPEIVANTTRTLTPQHAPHPQSEAAQPHDSAPPAALSAPTPSLTTRERETLELLSEGLSNKLIARRLRISEHTVKFHISALYAKLGASSRADAVSRAARRGVLSLMEPHDATAP